MIKRKSKKSVARKRTAAKKTAPRKMKRGYDIHAGKPTGPCEGLTPADALTRAREEVRANPRRDWRGG